jgi:hypothetical protein
MFTLLRNTHLNDMTRYDIHKAEDGFILRIEWEVEDGLNSKYEDVTHVFSNDGGGYIVSFDKMVKFLRKDYEET